MLYKPRNIKFTLLIGLLLLCGWTLLTYLPTLKRAYALATMTEPDRIADNFMAMEEAVEVNYIAASDGPVPIGLASTKYNLPIAFSAADGEQNTVDFLLHTGSTGLLILQHGKIIYEQYWQGMQPDTTHISFSVAKSFTSALVGIAIAEGLIDSVDDPVVKYVPILKESGYASATLADCLEMSGGLAFDEDYTNPKSDIARFQQYYALGGAVGDYIADLQSERAPGSYNKYNSMDAQVVGMVLKAVLGDRTLSDYMHEKLWQPLGAEYAAQWMIDSEGMELALGGLNVALRDYAKFGQLFLQRGLWQGKQIIPASWVDLSTTPHAAHLMPGRDNPLSSKPYGYSYLWWTPEQPYGNDYFAAGIYNQYIYVNPLKSLVVVKTTANPHFNSEPARYKAAYIALFQTIAKSL